MLVCHRVRGSDSASLLAEPRRRVGTRGGGVLAANIALLVVAGLRACSRAVLLVATTRSRSVGKADTVVEVNNVFHQSMAPVDHSFLPVAIMVFGDTFQNVLVLGAG